MAGVGKDLKYCLVPSPIKYWFSSREFFFLFFFLRTVGNDSNFCAALLISSLWACTESIIRYGPWVTPGSGAFLSYANTGSLEEKKAMATCGFSHSENEWSHLNKKNMKRKTRGTCKYKQGTIKYRWVVNFQPKTGRHLPILAIMWPVYAVLLKGVISYPHHLHGCVWSCE